MSAHHAKLLLLSSVFCSACAIGPAYRRPVAQAPPAFKELVGSDQWKTATPSDTLMRGKWWEVFGDPQLNALEEMVATGNFSVKQAEAQFRQARAIVLVNRSAYYPTIGSNPSINQGDRASGPTSSFSLPFTATWEPDLWGRVRLAVEAATANAQVSAADLANVRLSLQGTLAIDYFTLLGTDMQLALLNETIAGYQRYLTLTQNRFNGGIASKVDITLAQTQIYTTQAAATDLGVARNQLEHAIAVLTGRAPAEVSIPQGKIAGLPPAIPIALPSQLLERRPDIAAEERLVAAANANVGLAQTAYYPTLTLSATAGLSNANLIDLFRYGSRVWSAGPGISQTLFDFGRRGAQVRQFQAAYDATVAAYRQTVLVAFEQVEDNLSTLRVLAQEAEEQAQAVAAAEESVRLEIERYKGGLDTSLNVITTQNIALADERTAVLLEQRRLTAAVNLILALGGGWDDSTLPTKDQIRSTGLADPASTQKVAVPNEP